MGLRHAAALALILSAPAASAERAKVPVPVALAREYLRAWQQSLAAVVAEERYTQTVRQLPLGRDIESAQNASRTRTIVSDALLVHAPQDEAWLLFRDVLSVDGEPVRDRQRRFDHLFVRPDANLVATARRIADEGARYNIGTLFRNLNTPATALTFLDARYASSVRWRNPKSARLDGRDVVELEFEQRQAPFVIRTIQGHAVPAAGRLWVDGTTGRIEKTDLELSVPRRKATIRIVSTFGPIPGVDSWVPLQMSEEYEVTDRVYETLKGLALYTNHRVFQTSTRIIGDGGAAEPTPEQALVLARKYVSAWQDTLKSLITAESYTQELTRYVSTPGPARLPSITVRRRLRSEVLLLRAPAENIWLSFRDVVAVDGKSIGDRDRRRRFEALFSGPEAAIVSTAERIAQEGAQFNLGHPVRTINTPTAAFVFLHPDYEANTSWELHIGRKNGRPVWELRFNQRDPPFAVKIPGSVDHVASGSFHLEPDSGRILEWDLRVVADRARFFVHTRYGAVPSIPEGSVPLQMTEEYEVASTESLRGVATYSKHRLFRTGGRVIG